MSQCLTVHCVQHGVASAVGGSAGTLRGTLTVVDRHTAEGPLVNPTVLCTRERHAPMLEFVNSCGSMAHQIFDRVLITKPVRPLHGVIHVPAPVILVHVAKRG